MHNKKLFDYLYLESMKFYEKRMFFDIVEKTWNKGNTEHFFIRLMNTPGCFLNFFTLNKLAGKGNNIIFEGFRYKDIMNYVSKKSDFNVIAWVGFKEKGRNIFNQNEIFLPHVYVPHYDILKKIDEGVIKKDRLNFLIDKIYKDLSEIKNILKKINPVAIIFQHDTKPRDRAVALAAKQLNIPTIEIQHGLFMYSIDINSGKATEYSFVWGNFFKELYSEKKLKEKSKTFVLGYPYNLQKISGNSNDNKTVVYYLGQNLEEKNKEKFLGPVCDTLLKLIDLSKSLNFEFVYRPHGKISDALKNEIPDLPISSENEKLEEAFEKGDIFISYNSTALIEASIYENITIQLKNIPYQTDDLEKSGAVTKSSDTLEDLSEYLEEIIKSQNLKKIKKPFNKNYIEIPNSPGKRLINLLNEKIIFDSKEM